MGQADGTHGYEVAGRALAGHRTSNELPTTQATFETEVI
jgi:hypothetical protein